MKDTFESTEIEVICIEEADIITDSNEGPEIGG